MYAREIPLKQLRQWQLTEEFEIARWVQETLGLKGKPKKDRATGNYKLGTIEGEERLVPLELDFSDPISLRAFDHPRSLDDLVYFKDEKLAIDREMLSAMIDPPPVSSTETKEPHQRENTDRILEPEIGSLA